MGKGERIRGKHHDARKNAREFIQQNRKLLGINLDNLQFEQLDKSEPFKHVTFRQHFCGVPVVGNRVTVHLIAHIPESKIFINEINYLFLKFCDYNISIISY